MAENAANAAAAELRKTVSSKEELVVALKSQVAGLLKDKESISKTAEAGRLCIWQLHRVAVLSLRSSPNYVWQAGMLGRQMQALEASKGADSARQDIWRPFVLSWRKPTRCRLGGLKLRFSSICPAH